MPLVPVVVHDQNRLMMAVGEALAVWTKVELGISLLFTIVSQIPVRARSGAIFDAIVSFEGRMDICDRLMALEVTDELETEMWKRMSARIRKFHKKRHEIAHFNILAIAGTKTIGLPHIAPFFTYEKWLNEQVNTLSESQVNERKAKFRDIAEGIWWFTQRAAERAQPEEYPMQENEQPPPLVVHIRALADRILEERKQPHPPKQG